MIVHQQTITTTQNQPLIGILLEENWREVIRYFAEEIQADHALTENAMVEALNLTGGGRIGPRRR